MKLEQCELINLYKRDHEIGWLTDDKSANNSAMKKPDVILNHNDSKRYESRFSIVTVPENTNSIMLSKLRGTRLGVWVAHGEGKFQLNDQVYNMKSWFFIFAVTHKTWGIFENISHKFGIVR